MRGLDFLRHVLPPTGLYVGWARKGELRRQWSFQTIEELYDTLLRANAQGFECYHAVAAYQHAAGVWNERKQKYELRSHANVRALRGLHADIDTRESKPDAVHADRQAAYEAVVAFCQAARIPLPVCVSSGGGLHIYWPLDCELLLGEFESLARGLKSRMHQLGLAADPTRTADASSVLRTPGTTHHKSLRIVECGELVGPYAVELFEHLKGYANENGGGNKQASTGQHTGSRSSVARAAAAVYGNDPSDPGAIARSCQQLIRFSLEAGKSSEPEWYAVCGLLGICGEGGRRFAHELANGYRGFARADTDRWVDEKIAQWQGATSGPPTCAHFESINPGGCKGCRFEGKITSPIILGRGYQVASDQPNQTVSVEAGQKEIPETVAPIPLPEPWQWSETNQLVLMEEDSRGNLKPTVVSEFPIYLDGVHLGETVANVSYTFQQFLPHHGWKRITIGAGVMFTGQGIPALHEAGAVVRDPKLFLHYVRDALDAWHKEHKMKFVYEQCGWKTDDTEFLIGDDLYSKDGIYTVVVNDELTTRAQWLKPKEGGSVYRWTNAANALFMKERMAVQFLLLCSFAAPLMRFQSRSEGGAIVSGVNQLSGTGKSTTLLGVASVWGTPRGLELTSLDTAASKGLTFAAAGNLPIIFDELALMASTKQPELLRDFVMMYSQGRDRMRAHQGGTGIRHTQGEWQNLLVTASNLSIVDMLETFNKGVDAPGYRVIELKIPYAQHFDYAAGDRLKEELVANAGHAGAAFLRHLMDPNVLRFAKKASKQWADEIWRASGFKQQHRFWVRTIAAVAVAAELVRQLGLLAVDPQALVKWVLDELQHRSSPITGQEPETGMAGGAAVLGEFLADHQSDVLVVNHAWRAGDKATEPVRAPRMRLLIRFELQTSRLFTSQRTFREWCVNRGYAVTDTMRQMEESKILVEKRRVVTLGAGTNLASAPLPCIEFDMGHPAVSMVARELARPGTGMLVPGILPLPGFQARD